MCDCVGSKESNKSQCNNVCYSLNIILKSDIKYDIKVISFNKVFIKTSRYIYLNYSIHYYTGSYYFLCFLHNYTHIYLYIHTHYIDLHNHTLTFTHKHTHRPIHIYQHTNTQLHTHTNTHIDLHTNIHRHTYLHTNIHKHT